MPYNNLNYKIFILKLLNMVNAPLTNAQIISFFVDNTIADYFSAQNALSSLEETEMVDVKRSENTTFYRINDNGKNTLLLFPNHLFPWSTKSMEDYIKAQGLTAKNRRIALSDYDFDGSTGTYGCHLRLVEDETTIFDCTIHVGSVQAAEAVCTNWKTSYEKVYDSFFDILL